MALPDPLVTDLQGAQRNFEKIDTDFALKSYVDAAVAGVAAKVTTYPATVIATSQSRTNTAFGLLTTHDEVTGVVVPAKALVLVTYQATWRESVATAGRAAIFIGSNQLQVAARSGAPVTQGAGNAAGGSANIDTPLATMPIGLVSAIPLTTNYSGDVTTGQAVGIGMDAATSASWSRGGTVVLLPQAMSHGGPCTIGKLAAGTYTISVQFKSSSGSVTVKSRNLWVEVHDYS